MHSVYQNYEHMISELSWKDLNKTSLLLLGVPLHLMSVPPVVFQRLLLQPLPKLFRPVTQQL